MENPEEIRQPASQPPEEDSPLKQYARPLPLLGGLIIVLTGLTVLVLVVVTIDSQRRNMLLIGTAMFLLLMFCFAALIVRSYNREKRKLAGQDPYRNDHVVR